MTNEDSRAQVLSLELNEKTLPIIEQVTAGMPGGFFIYHADGAEELIYANLALARIFGCESLEEFRTYVNNSFRGMVHPEDLEQIEGSINTQITEKERGGLDYVEYRITRKDGVVRWIRDYGRFVHTELYGDVFYVFVEDGTERHLREISDAHAVKVAKERLEVLKHLEHETAALRIVHEIVDSSMWSMEFDEQGAMTSVFWSDEFRAMLGYQNENDFPNKLESWSDLLHEDDKERVLKEYYDTINDYTGKKAYSVEYRLKTKHRGWRWFQAAGKIARRGDGTPITYVGIFVDITHRKVSDEMLETQHKLLEDAMKQAQRANRAKSVFLSNVSHDLRTPMNAIMGFATLAKLYIGDWGTVEDYLDKIMVSSGELLTLISGLLDMSRIESGFSSVNAAPCTLTDLLSGLEKKVRSEAGARRLDFSVECGDLSDATVLCDQKQLEQILMNILGNALKFTPPGGQVSLCLTQSQGAPQGYGFYEFKIRDTGIGMKPDFLELLFEPFQREGRDKPGDTPGMGLGMAITKNIVEMMGGSIRVASQEGEGSEFTVSLQFLLPQNAG